MKLELKKSGVGVRSPLAVQGMEPFMFLLLFFRLLFLLHLSSFDLIYILTFQLVSTIFGAIKLRIDSDF